MERKDLDTCLSKVFLNDYSPDPTSFLAKVISLAAYYSEDDMSESMKEDINHLQGILVKAELLKKILHHSYPDLPQLYRCDLASEHKVSEFTFSPVVNMPEYSSTSDNLVVVDEISKNIIDIDVSALLAYVKKKAAIAGDFTLI